MKLFFNIVDKFIFAALLLLALQVPILADHYLQYLTGYFDATESQVNGFKINAARNAYPDVYAMLVDLQQNPNPAVRLDAEQKLATLEEYEMMPSALTVLRDGNILQKSAYMFNPGRQERLGRVLENFEPGIPLNIEDAIFALVLALLLNLVFLLPGKCVGWLWGHTRKPKRLNSFK